ncbi:MAG: DUF4268 domain-containing protein, partial [Anaerolineae bacterium]|nr:DUF4268 domain-containing protein [Anaerolineae bacterium]NIQ80569.1 DUF4268 domain-containing protein [Anaerolineae bacterium]
GGEKETRETYDGLLARRTEIEAAFGEPLIWSAGNGTRRCMISYGIDLGGLKQEDKWPEIQEAMIDAMRRFEKALRPYIDSLNV